MNTTLAMILLIPLVPPTISGNLKLNLTPLVYSDIGNNLWLELAYEIPFTSLSFLRDTAGFLAYYRFSLEFYDRNKNILAAEVRENEVLLAEYRLTVNQDSFVRGVLPFLIPQGAIQTQVTVSDLFSERRATTEFPIKKENGAILLRFLKSGQPNPSRTYGIHDTVIIAGEVKSSVSPGTSIRFTIKKGRRNIISDVVPLSREDGGFRTLFTLPISDSSNNTFLNAGEYTVEASLIPIDTITGKTRFRIEIPFFYDDSLWTLKVDQLLYIATYEEIKKLKKTQRAERKEAWKAFWEPKDPNASTEINEDEEEYFKRIAYCEEHFRRGDRGYRSDRARIYVTCGPPDQIESRPFDIDRPAEEIWYYYQNNRTFVFVDRFGSGEFVLSNPKR